MNSKKFGIKILDMKYLEDFAQLAFQYLHYEVIADNEVKALQYAKALYMKGEKALLTEELPFLLKLFSIIHSRESEQTKG